VQFGESYDWRDAARPMPFGLSEGDDGEPAGETFVRAGARDRRLRRLHLYEETGGQGACTVHDARPLICQTYPFSVALDGTSQPMGEAVDAEGAVRAHECEGLGRDISREDAEAAPRRAKSARSANWRRRSASATATTRPPESAPTATWSSSTPKGRKRRTGHRSTETERPPATAR